MAKQQRISPVGLDGAIARHQNYLFSSVKVGGNPLANWESYDRVYKNPKKNNTLIPQHFTGGKDYKEVFYNDAFTMSSYYIDADDARPFGADMLQNVSLIVMCNIDKIYPSIAHRADQEIRDLFIFLCNNYSGFDNFKFTGMEKTIDRVFREFDQSDIKLDDMSYKHCFRLNFEVMYTPECCTNC